MSVIRYQFGQDDIVPEAPQEIPQGVRTNADAGRTTQVTYRNGVPVEQGRGVERVTGSQLNPYADTGTVFETARSKHGMGVIDIKADTLITIAGVQAPVSFFEKQGLVHRGADGNWQEGSGRPEEAPQESPEADTVEELSMPADVAKAVDAALEGVADHHLDPLIAIGVGVATGQLGMEKLQAQMVKASGARPEDAAARLEVGVAAYKAQADSAVVNQIGADDMADFWTYCRENHPRALRDAINAQVYSRDPSGYRQLADSYCRANPPSVAAVEAAGFETRKMGPEAEVFIDGRWVPIKTAARIGMF